LGSSLGILSSHIANRLTEEYKLICVEANPSLLLNLNDNLVQNAHHLRSYEIINAVIDYRGEEYVNFFISDHNTTSSTLVETSEKHNIKTITLNRIIKDYHIGKYALVMDIEGAEFDIIKYDKKSLDQCQMIIAELHKSTSLVEGNSKDAKVKDTASVNDLIELICSYGFILSKRRDCVCLFERK
jgi:FkbM family methyltransferase